MTARCDRGKEQRKRTSKTVLKVPHLEVSRPAVLNCLPSLSSCRSYDHAIREFIDWYCSESRLAFNRIRARIAKPKSHVPLVMGGEFAARYC